MREIVLAIALICAVAAPGRASVSYTRTDLGEMFAYSINNSGQVIGSSWPTDRIGSNARAYLWQAGSWSALSLLGGSNSGGMAINNLGRAAGWAEGAGGREHAVTWNQGGVTDIGGQSGFARAVALGMNDQGDLVGWVSGADYLQRVALWSNGTFTDLGATSGDTAATDINNHGLIVGSFGSRAATWTGTTMTLLGAMGSHANAVNDTGQIVGWSPDGGWHATLWYNGTETNLGTAFGSSSYAYDVNSAGQVVGWCQSGIAVQGVLWDHGVPVDLGRDTGGVEFISINDHGQIVGNSYTGGAWHAVLFTPAPEPSGLGTLVIGTAGAISLVLRRRRSRRWQKPR